MEYGKFISSELSVFYVLEYYLFFWFLNTVAYGIVSYGVWRWWRFSHGLALEHVLRTTFWITSTFGGSRLVFGLIGVTALTVGAITKLEAVFVLGITSLCLNSTFILLEGLMLNREANLLFAGTEEVRNLRRAAMKQFESLRVITNA